jgi:small conductance mechanosensitive channel
MTSAGIVSVVIGIGANSLVGDILAGIFLLIEGNIQVGDMISIEGFRGIVEDLGIRMTKIYDVDSEDIKIIPNKEVQNVVHMSAHPANLFLEYQICYEEDLERVEKLLIEELKNPEGRIPEMIGDLKYLGVSRLDESGVVLLVRARCHEAYRPRVTMAVNRKIYLMFNRNGIEVPFPQLTIHSEKESD